MITDNTYHRHTCPIFIDTVTETSSEQFVNFTIEVNNKRILFITNTALSWVSDRSAVFIVARTTAARWNTPARTTLLWKKADINIISMVQGVSIDLA